MTVTSRDCHSLTPDQTLPTAGLDWKAGWQQCGSVWMRLWKWTELEGSSRYRHLSSVKLPIIIGQYECILQRFPNSVFSLVFCPNTTQQIQIIKAWRLVDYLNISVSCVGLGQKSNRAPLGIPSTGNPGTLCSQSRAMYTLYDSDTKCSRHKGAGLMVRIINYIQMRAN